MAAPAAVFLSYASEDAEPARRIAEALRAAGVEVWFDQNELVGGDAWDQKIRKEIKECALLIPIISANTQSRTEGYFRLEWRLADQRTHLMAKGRPFLLPVVIDDTRDSDAQVPDSFLEVQWTRLPAGETSAKFTERVMRLLAGGTGGGARPGLPGTPAGSAPVAGGSRPRWIAPVVGGVTVALVAVAIARPWAQPTGRTVAPPGPATAGQGERELVAQAWELMNRPTMARAELAIADGLCRRATELAPTDAEGWAAWSFVDAWYCYHAFDLSPERREGARAKAARALQLAPTSFEARLAQANYLVREGSDAAVSVFATEADQTLRVLLQERPQDPRALLSFAILQRNLGHSDEARAALQTMAKIPAAAALAWHEMAWVELRAGYPEIALQLEERSIALQPGWLNLTGRMTLLQQWRGDLAAARQVLDQIPAAAMQEDYPAAAAMDVLYQLRDPVALLRLADAIPREWLLCNWFTGPLDWWRGRAEQQAGHSAAARVRWQSALKLVERRLAEEPSSAMLIGWKGRLLAVLGDTAEGAKLLQLAREMGEPNPGKFGAWTDPLLVGERDKVLAGLQSALDAGRPTPWAESLRHMPEFDGLRADPRFQALQARFDADPRLSPGAVATKREPGAVVLPDDKSVAVLAFANLSDDKANEYFSDGISEELLNVLAKVSGLKVAARTSAFYFKGKAVPVPEIAKQLGVAYVVEGSVRKAGDKVRITAQLIKASDGFHVWSDTFTRDLKDVFAVQDEIAGLIAQSLTLKLGRTAAATFDGVNPEAYQLFLEARQAVVRRTRESYDIAEDLLNRALTLAPRFARAQAALGIVWELRTEGAESEMSFGQRESANNRRIEAKVREALDLDAQAPEAHAALGLLSWNRWRFDEGVAALQEAIRLNPNYASAHQWLGRVRANQGRLDESLASLQRAAELDPLAPRILDNYARPLAFAGRAREVLALAERALRIQPGAIQPVSMKALAQADLGDADGAVATLRELPTDDSLVAHLHPLILAHAGRQAEIERLLRDGVLNGFFARFTALVAVGRTSEAMAMFDADNVNSNKLDFLLFDRVYDPIRSDPKFVAALETMQLTEIHARAQAWRRAHGLIK